MRGSVLVCAESLIALRMFYSSGHAQAQCYCVQLYYNTMVAPGVQRELFLLLIECLRVFTILYGLHWCGALYYLRNSFTSGRQTIKLNKHDEYFSIL